MTKQSPMLAVLLEELKDGEWHDGMTVVRALERTIPPGVASRIGANRRTTPATNEELIRSGRRDKAREIIRAALDRGRIKTDAPSLGKRAWAGAEPWQLRDPQAGWMSIQEVADALGVGDHVVRTWVRNDFVPHTATPAGLTRLSREHFAIAKRVHAIYTPGSLRWAVDPRSVWTETEAVALPTIACPHCGEAITLTVGKP